MKESKYNPVTGEWEVVPSDWIVQYIPQTGEFKYAPPPAEGSIQYNTVTGDFQIREENSKPLYNTPGIEFELGTDLYESTYNPVTGKWEMKPRDTEDDEDTEEVDFFTKYLGIL